LLIWINLQISKMNILQKPYNTGAWTGIAGRDEENFELRIFDCGLKCKA